MCDAKVMTPKAEEKTLRRTEPKEVRRRQLIDATILSISRHGIGGTTMSTVTEIAGLSIGIVNFHFQSKQNLLEETLMFLAREHQDYWRRAHRQTELTARDKLSAIVEAHYSPATCTPEKLSVWFAFYGESGRRAVYRDLLDAYDNERLDVSQALCAEIIAEGDYDGDPALVAGTLESLFDGLCLSLLMYPDTFSPAQARAHVYGYLASMFPQHFENAQKKVAR